MMNFLHPHSYVYDAIILSISWKNSKRFHIRYPYFSMDLYVNEIFSVKRLTYYHSPVKILIK